MDLPTPLDGAAVLRALPEPATLVDLGGTILDVNDAFLDLAERTGKRLTREDRIGRHLLDNVDDISRDGMTALLAALAEGRSTEYEEHEPRPGTHPIVLKITCWPVRDRDGRPIAGIVLREDRTEEELYRVRRTWMQSVREAVWEMESADDLGSLLKRIDAGFVDVGFPYEAWGVNLVSEDLNGISVHSHTMVGGRLVETAQSVDSPVVTFWREGGVHYRRDLRADDPYGESRPSGRPTRSVVDVAFNRGTLAVSATEPDAFDARDLDFLRLLAGTLDTWFRRARDLDDLERRNQALQDEVERRRLAEAALGEREAHYRSLVDDLPVALIHSSPDGALLYRNAAHRALLGYSDETLKRLPTSHLFVNPLDREMHVRELEEQGEREFEVALRHEDGHTVWVQGASHVLRDESGKVTEIRGYLLDVGERRRREVIAELRSAIWRMASPNETDRFLQILHRYLRVAGVPAHGISVHLFDPNDLTGNVLNFRCRPGQTVWERAEFEALSPIIASIIKRDAPLYRRDLLTEDLIGERERVSRTHGIPVRSVLNVPFSGGVLGVNSPSPEAFSNEDIHSLQQVASVLSEGFQRRADLLALEQRNRELEDQISRRERLEQTLRQAQKMEVAGQLAAGLAHNLNNLLQGVMANVELLAEDQLGEESQHSLQQARLATDRAVDIVRQLLVFSRHSREQISRTLELREIVSQTVTMARSTIDRRIEIELHLDDRLPAITSTPGQLEQVLLNLLFNARDALGDRSEPRVVVRGRYRALTDPERERAHRPDAHHAVISIEDNGAGISAAEQSRIFEPFYSTKDVGEGTGLGLFTAYGIVEGHDGWITCQSTAGQGSTFTIYLPEAARQTAEPTAQTASSLPAARDGEVVLLVDDEQVVRQSVGRLVERCGYEVRMAEDGPSALEALEKTERVDVLLLDLAMPGMSGAEVARRVRTDHPGVRVILFTGYAAGDEEFEADEVLHKPLSAMEIASALRRVLDAPA